MAMQRHDEADRRNFLRLRVDCPVRCQSVDRQREFSGRCLNLSGRGILFETAQSVQPGAHLDISVAPEQARIQPLQARVEILRVRNGGEGLFEVAARMLAHES